MPYIRGHNPEYSEIGRLQVGTLAVGQAKPASGAIVRVSEHGQPDNIIEEMISDSSGRTPTINLPAPPIDYSMTPDPARMPYSEYDVSVSMEGYEPVYIEGVQILPETASFQDANLQPLTAENAADIIAIKDHTLWGDFPPKIPEMDTKSLPPSTGLVVLPEPVVPEYVIVHAGKPDDATAPNHWVPFRDYIKNVASSEIYANWPEETIKANVLAILSFTLNRIYTEWYPSKGFDFTITNSTAFDHAFSFGRNIFEEISRVVDEIFTTFITRPNIRQPLLTQYCDGKRVSCPTWMTQWGSKQMGDQGYNAIDILKRFYGYDIFLMQAKKVAGVPSSYPGTALQMGSTGSDVRVIQEQLNAISNNFPAIKKVRVDGLFGEETRVAVETFQEIFRLAADGIVGFSTWYKISQIYVAVTRMAELR
ncbi:MAG: peptidoglycan-binding protein [Oscillospiraceae bacterium]|nr:peptidoglycan-binding protein [Oscillospiraceae bacterium]